MNIKQASDIANPWHFATRLLSMKQELEDAAKKYGFDLEFEDKEYNEENHAIPFTLIQTGLHTGIYEDGIKRIEGKAVAWFDGECEIDDSKYSEGMIDAWVWALDGRGDEPEYRPERWENA